MSRPTSKPSGKRGKPTKLVQGKKEEVARIFVAIESIRQLLSNGGALSPEESDHILQTGKLINEYYGSLSKMDKYSESSLFAYKLQWHLEKLRWTYTDLAHHLDVSPSLISLWLGSGEGRPVRLPAKEDICRIAWVITGGQDGLLKRARQTEDTEDDPNVHVASESGAKKIPGERSGRGELAFVLDELLGAAGYEGVQGRGENWVWERLSGRAQLLGGVRPRSEAAAGQVPAPELRVGWLRSWPLLYPPDNPDDVTDGGPQGLAADITRCLANYLGVRIRWVTVPWADLGRCLREGEIDMVAPMAVHVPKRMIDMNFTRPLPWLRCGLNCVLNKNYHIKISKTGREPKGLSDVDLTKVKIEYTPGNFGAYGVPLFVPRGSVKHEAFRPVGNQTTEFKQKQQGTGLDPLVEPNLQAVRDDLIHNPRAPETERVRCYLSGQLVCHSAIKGLQDKLTPLFPLKESPVKLPYAFGIAHTEPRFHQIVDSTLGMIFEDSELIRRIYLAARDDLRILADAGVLDSAAAALPWLHDVLKSSDNTSESP